MPQHDVSARRPSTPSRALTPQPTAAERLLAIPHLVESIAGSATRNTQVTLLRVSEVLHHAAGREVYRCLTLDQAADNRLRWVMRGALIGSSAYGPYPVDCATFTIEFLTPGLGRHLGKLFALDDNIPYSTPIVDAIAMEVIFGSKDFNFKPIKRNFKRALLSYTKVLTIGTHHSCSCDLFAEQWADLFPNVEVLRIAPRKSSDALGRSVAFTPFNLVPTCHPGHNACASSLTPCSLLTKLRPSKIVLRNMDGSAFPVPDGYVWDVPGVKSVV